MITTMPTLQATILAKAILSEVSEKSPDINTLTLRVNALTERFDFWNRWMLFGLIFAAFAAIWVGVTTRMTIVRAKQLTVAQTELDAAKESIAAEKTAKALEEAAKATDRAAQADLKRVELQTRIVDIFGRRELSAEQKKRIRENLKGLRGVKVDVLVIDDPGNAFTGSSDSLGLASSILEVLRDAHLDAAGWRLGSCKVGAAIGNLTVVSMGNSDDHDIAVKIVGALSPEIETYSKVQSELPACEKYADLELHNPNRRGHDAKISIGIGTKAQPILTLEMLEPAARKP